MPDSITNVVPLTEDVRQTLASQEFEIENLREALGTLELALEDEGWTRLQWETNRDFSREGLRKIIELSGIFYLKNPLIRRSVDLQTFYVFAQGCEIHHADEQMQAVLTAFLDDNGNWCELGDQGRMENEKTLQNEGSIFFVFFVDRSSGYVRIRTLDVDEICDVLTNPEDRSEPWFYKREWQERGIEPNRPQRQRTAYYPDWRYQPPPGARRASIDGKPVEWDTPVYHVKVGALKGMKFGVPETYPSQDWAFAYTKFLSDFATLARAYSRWAHKLTTPGGARAVAASKTKLGSNVSTSTAETNPPPVAGSTFIQSPGTDLQPLRIGGANVSADDARRLLLMVAAGSGWPETFYGDASIGNHATAKTLDRPSELKIQARQKLWKTVMVDITGFVFEQAATAPNGPLRGYAAPVSDVYGRETLRWNDGITPYAEVEFPPIVQHDVNLSVSAIVDAATLKGQTPAGTLDRRETVKQLLTVLGTDDIDEAMQRLFPPETENEPDPWLEAAKLKQDAAKTALEQLKKGPPEPAQPNTPQLPPTQEVVPQNA